MTMIDKDPEFLASWQRVEKCLSFLDESQVVRLFSEHHTSLTDFYQALTHEMDIKLAAKDDYIASLERSNELMMSESQKMKSDTEKMKTETNRLQEETNRMKAQITSIKHQIDVLGKH